MDFIGSHKACLDNLADMAAICRAHDGVNAANLNAGELAGLARRLESNGVGRFLGQLPVNGAALTMPGQFAAALGQARLAERILGPGNPGGEAAAAQKLKTLLSRLDGNLPRAAAFSQADLDQHMTLLNAAQSLAAHRIHIFHPGGGAALTDLIRRLRGNAVVPSGFALPTPMNAGLGKLTGFAEGMQYLRGPALRPSGRALPSINAHVPDEAIGSVAMWRTAEIWPDLDGLWLRLRHRFLLNEYGRMFPAQAGSMRASSPDPLAALERSGCCEALRNFPELGSHARTASRADGAARGIAAIRHGLDVDIREPGSSAKLSSAVAAAVEHTKRAPAILHELAARPQQNRAGQLFSVLAEGIRQGLLSPVAR